MNPPLKANTVSLMEESHRWVKLKSVLAIYQFHATYNGSFASLGQHGGHCHALLNLSVEKLCATLHHLAS